MRQEDFYSGEPVITGSPPLFAQNEGMIINTSQNTDSEAASMASFGKYDYDPGSRVAMVPVSIYPGAQGYNPQPTYGIGAPPPQYGYGYGGYYTPYGNPQPTYRNYQQPMWGYPQQQQQPQIPKTVHIPGININGEYMPPSDYQERIDSMEMEYFSKRMDQEAKQSVDRQTSVYGGGYGYGYNYYGMPYFNPYQYNALNNEFSQRIEQMKDEARENRMQFNLQIARLAHNFSGQTISEEDLRERYVGRDVDVPQVYQITPEEYWEQSRFIAMVPFDNSQAYRDHRAMVQREFNKIIPADANLVDTFKGMGIIYANWEMEEEMHRRKNAGLLYNTSDNSYKYFVRRKAQERYAREKGVILPGSTSQFTDQQVKAAYVAQSPILSQSAQLADDGTLNVSINLPCNVGSRKGENYTVYNSQESEYEQKRERFGRFLDSIPGNIYLDQQKQAKLESYNGQ